MNLSFAKIISKGSSKKANIYLSGDIGWEANAYNISAEIDYIADNKLVDEIHVRINSGGGIVTDGFLIVASLLRAKENGVKVMTFNEGYAMSMAFVIWTVANTGDRYMRDFAQNMAHAPYYPQDVDQSTLTDSDKEFLNRVYDQISGYLQKTLGKSGQEVKVILSRDTFMSARETVELGYIPEKNIIKTSVTLNLKGLSVNDGIKKIRAYYNDSNENNKSNIKMEILKRINNMLGLRDEASETITVEAVNQLKTDIQDRQNKITNLEKDLTDKSNSLKDAEAKLKEYEEVVNKYKEAEKTAKEKDAVNKVEQGIKDGKIDKNAKDNMIAFAKKDPENFDLMLKSIQVKAPDIASIIDKEEDARVYNVKSEEFNYETLEEKYPEVLDKIKEEKPKLYNQLADDYAKKYSK